MIAWCWWSTWSIAMNWLSSHWFFYLLILGSWSRNHWVGSHEIFSLSGHAKSLLTIYLKSQVLKVIKSQCFSLYLVRGTHSHSRSAKHPALRFLKTAELVECEPWEQFRAAAALRDLVVTRHMLKTWYVCIQHHLRMMQISACLGMELKIIYSHLDYKLSLVTNSSLHHYSLPTCSLLGLISKTLDLNKSLHSIYIYIFIYIKLCHDHP